MTTPPSHLASYRGHRYRGLIPLMREFWQLRNGFVEAAATEIFLRFSLAEPLDLQSGIGGAQEAIPLVIALYFGVRRTLCDYKRSTGFYLPYDHSPISRLGGDTKKTAKEVPPQRRRSSILRLGSLTR